MKFAEEAGLLFENAGLTRMAGRLYGYLLVAEQEQVSFNALIQKLQASKSSISLSTRMLQQAMFIEAVTLPGDRKTYFRVRSNFMEMFQKSAAETARFKSLFGRALELRVDATDDVGKYLKEAHHFYSWIENQMPDLIERWKRERERL
ncbi:GbsR/MarR family transcriptional regulator [Catalinimonas alkaloidigena]|nr:hypothetical protein [Catalinimonas alkaloidigena]